MYINFPLMLGGATVVIVAFVLIRIFLFKVSLGRVFAEALFGYYLAALFSITLFPDLHGMGYDPFASTYWINLVPFETINNVIERNPSQIRTQIGGNLVLLFPLGLFAPALFPRLRSVKAMLIMAIAAPVCIELLQFCEVVLQIAARSVDIDDVILNATGFIVGYLLFLICHFLYAALTHRRAPSAKPAQ